MIRSSAFLAVFVAVASPAFAHHGPGTFELGKTVTYENAKLTRIELINPHSWLYFETTEPDGKVAKHRCEMRSAHTLRRSGWEPELFKVGAKMTVTASPDKADVASCYLQTIMFENGIRMDRYGQYVKAGSTVTEVRGQAKPPDVTKRAPRRPTGEPNISGDWAPEQVVMVDPRGAGGGLVPLSTIGQYDTGQRARGGGAGGAPSRLSGTRPPPVPRGSAITTCSGAQSPLMFGSPLERRGVRPAVFGAATGPRTSVNAPPAPFTYCP